MRNIFAYTVNTEKLDQGGKKKRNISSKSQVWFGSKPPKPNFYLVAQLKNISIVYKPKKKRHVNKNPVICDLYFLLAKACQMVK